MKLPLLLAGAALGGFALLTAAWTAIDAQRAPVLAELTQAGHGPVAGFACYDQDDAAQAAKAFGEGEVVAGFRIHGDAEHWDEAMHLVDLQRCAMVSPGVPHRTIRQEGGLAEVEFRLSASAPRLWLALSDAQRL